MVEEDNKIKPFGKTKEELVDEIGVPGHLLVEKAELYEKITDLSNKLIDARTSEKSQLGDLWLNTIWDEVIEGKATDKTKKAYVDEHIREHKEDCERLQNQIDECWRKVDLINDYFKIGGIND